MAFRQLVTIISILITASFFESRILPTLHSHLLHQIEQGTTISNEEHVCISHNCMKCLRSTTIEAITKSQETPSRRNGEKDLKVSDNHNVFINVPQKDLLEQYVNLQDWLESMEGESRGIGLLEGEDNMAREALAHSEPKFNPPGEYLSCFHESTKDVKVSKKKKPNDNSRNPRNKKVCPSVSCLAAPSPYGFSTVKVEPPVSNVAMNACRENIYYQTGEGHSSPSGFYLETEAGKRILFGALKTNHDRDSQDTGIIPAVISGKESERKLQNDIQKLSQGTTNFDSMNQIQTKDSMLHTAKIVRTLQHRGLLEMKFLDQTLLKSICKLLQEAHGRIFETAMMEDINDLELLKKIESALERTQYSLLTKFFGILGIIHDLNEGCFSRSELLYEGSVFLNHFLKGWKSITIKDIQRLGSKKHIFGKKHPKSCFQLLGYMMNMEPRSELSYASLLNLVEIFSKWQISQNRPVKFPHNEKRVTERCWDVYGKQGYIKKFTYGVGKRNNFNGMQEASSKEGTTSSTSSTDKNNGINRKNPERKVIKFTMDRGKKLISSCDGLEHKVTQFFKTLNLQLVMRCNMLSAKAIQDLKNQYRRGYKMKYKTTQADPTVQELMKHLIKHAQFFLTPMFLDLGLCYNNHHRKFTTSDLWLEEGWKFLQTYFLTWVDSLGSEEGGQSFKKRKWNWSSNKDVIQNLLVSSPSKQPPSGLVKYLFAQWTTIQ